MLHQRVACHVLAVPDIVYFCFRLLAAAAGCCFWLLASASVPFSCLYVWVPDCSHKRLYMEGSHKNSCSWRLNASTGADGTITVTQSGAHVTEGDHPCGSMASARRLSPQTKEWICSLMDMYVSKDRIYEFCLHPERVPKGELWICCRRAARMTVHALV